MTVYKSAQEVFDKVATHLFTQGQQATKPNTNTCSYLTIDGRKCAIGALIPNDLIEKYDLDHYPGGNGISAIYKRVLEVTNLFGFSFFPTFLADLQRLHDKKSNWSDDNTMKKALMHVAREHGLDTSILDKLSFNRNAA